MLVSFFKPNHPVTLLIALPLMLIVLRLPGILAFPVNPNFAEQGFLFDLFIRLCNFIPYAGVTLSLIFVYLQCLLVNRIVNHYELLKPATNLPALLYGLIMSFSVDVQMLHPVIIANFFVIFALGRMCSGFNQKAIFSEAFDAAMLIALASFFYFPSIIFYLFIFLNLVFTRPFVWREYVISLLGLLLPYLFLFTWYFWTDQLFEVIRNQIIPFFQPAVLNIPDLSGSTAWAALFLGILLLFSVFVIIQYMIKNILRIQYLWRTLFILLVISSGVVLMSRDRSLYVLMLTAVPVSFFTAGYFLLMKARRLAEVLFTVLLMLIVYNIYF
jgi:hypothetical protein